MAVSKYSISITTIKGQEILDKAPSFNPSGTFNIKIPASSGNPLVLSETVLSKHILALGSIGSGKTNCLFHMVRSAEQQLGIRDRMIIFDAKGDYAAKFQTQGDVVIGNVTGQNTAIWNIFADIMDSPSSAPDIEILRQISATLFKKHIEKSNSPAFPSGARDLFLGLTLAFIRRVQMAGNPDWTKLNNKALKAFFMREVADPAAIERIINPFPDLQWLHMYIHAPQSATTQSYLAPLLAVVSEMFVGCFAEAGDFSVKKYILSGRKKLFIEYDAEYGCTMDSMYTVLLDIAMRCSIGRKAAAVGSIFYILDELPVLPALTYLDQIVNFGRSLGIKVIAGIQNSSQMDEKYDANKAASILSGFSTVMCFHLFDDKSRRLMMQRHGQRLCRIYSLNTTATDSLENLRDLSVIEDWDISTLKNGQCIVSMPDGDPFYFYPALYNGGIPQISSDEGSGSQKKTTRFTKL